MTLATVLLGVLADGPAHGYDLKSCYDQRFPGTKALAYGQVYAALAALEKRGEVESTGTAAGKGPDRTTYAITESGQRALAQWLSETEPAGGYAADELVRKVVTALHLGDDAAGFLARQRAVHLAAMRALTRELADVTDVARRIAIDHTLSHLDADLRWLDSSRQRVAERTSSS